MKGFEGRSSCGGWAEGRALHRPLARSAAATALQPIHERPGTCPHLLCPQQVQVKPGLGADPSAASFSSSRFGRSSSFGSFGGYGAGGYAAALAHRRRAGGFGGSPGFVRGGALVPSSDGAGMELRPSPGSAAAQVGGTTGVQGAGPPGGKVDGSSSLRTDLLACCGAAWCCMSPCMCLAAWLAMLQARHR